MVLLVSLLAILFRVDKNIVVVFFKFLFLINISLFLINIFLFLGNKIKNIIYLNILYIMVFLIISHNKYKHIGIYFIYFYKFFSLTQLFIQEVLYFIIIFFKKYKIEHVCVLLYMCILNYQILLFGPEKLINVGSLTTNIKTNYLHFVDFYKNLNFCKNINVIEDIQNLNSLYSNVFEKYILSTNTSELYNFNNQNLVQICLNLLYYLFLFIEIILIYRFLFYLNKEHCFYINI